MRAYTFRLLGPDFEDTGAFIADGNSKDTAINKARRYMKDNGIKVSHLEVSSTRTYDLLDLIEIHIKEDDDTLA